MIRLLQNISGFFLQIGFAPFLLYLFIPTNQQNVHSTPLMLLILSLISFGLIGAVYTEIVILRFGDGRSHFNSKPSRLIDVGLYARNRHPYFWFLSIYHLGIFLLFFQTYQLALGYWFIILGLGILYFILVQERLLLRSLGSRYSDYKNLTPMFFWKIKIKDSQTLKVIPQLLWVFGRVVLKLWYRIRVSGTRNIPHEKPFVLVANHESYLDPFLFALYTPFELHFVTTADVFTNKFMNYLLKGIGTFPMRRHRQDLRSIRTMLRFIKEGRAVGIFPEGGRTLDGSPLPIVDETIKLIQKCKVPILPVQISGAYEIWPRWAPNMRRAQFKAAFKPLIPVAEQSNIDELRKLIQRAIFPTERYFHNTASNFIVKGLERYLWACPECQSQESIEIASRKSITCRACDAAWTMDDQYLLTNNSSGTPLSLVEWNKQIEAPIIQNPLTIDLPVALEEGELLYLHSTIRGYETDTGDSLKGDLDLTLTNKRFILRLSDAVNQEWNLDKVTVFTLDFAHAFSIGVGGVRHRFLLEQNDVRFKWRAYFDTLTKRSSA